MEWPRGMYTADSVNMASLREVKVYFEALQSAHPFEWRGLNEFVVFGSRHVIFRAALFSVSQKDDCYKDLVQFESSAGSRRRVVIESCGDDVEALSLKAFMSLTFLKRANNFKIQFLDSGFSISVEKSEEKKVTVYKFGHSSSKAVLLEEKSEDRLYSELYYLCPTCSMDPLVAIFEEVDGVQRESFRIGALGRPVSSYDFFTAANSHYLSWIFGQGSLFVKDGLENAQWPAVK